MLLQGAGWVECKSKGVGVERGAAVGSECGGTSVWRTCALVPRVALGWWLGVLGAVRRRAAQSCGIIQLRVIAMKGDRILVREHHRRAAHAIAELWRGWIGEGGLRSVVTIAGESGSGKSEIATALLECLAEEGTNSVVLQQDDYFVYPPKTNAEMRRRDIAHVGPSEVRLSELDRELSEFLEGARRIEKPLADFDADKIEAESVDLGSVDVVIVEGTYTTLLKNAGRRVFIDRTYRDTREARLLRAREEQDAFLEEVLEIEHGIISSHKAAADIIVGKDYDVEEQHPGG